MSTNNSLEKTNQKLKDSLTLRLVAITVLVLLLLIPTAMVKDMIRERESYQDEAAREVGQKWGKEQFLKGPVLNVPYYEYKYDDWENDEEKKREKSKRIAHFLPKQLNIEGNLTPKQRHRGIYNVIVYQSSINVSGLFTQPDFEKLGIERSQLIPEEAFLSIGIPDLRGIKDRIKLNWNKNQTYCSPGVPDHGLIKNGVNAPVKLDSLEQAYHFDFNIALNGSESINFFPMGKETRVKIESSWPSPKFDGNFLPDTHNITDEGFEAHWKILNMNRGFPQQWVEQEFNVHNTNFGLELITPVDTYQKSMRTIKYAILVIVLTFLIFFFSELRSKRKIHPLQYILVGLALVLFYSLLVSLSEHIAFGWAFLSSALSIMLLISVYSGYIFREIKTSTRVFFFLGIIYAFIFTLLQLENYALLAGNIGLFIILAVIMWVSRKMNWMKTKEDTQAEN